LAAPVLQLRVPEDTLARIDGARGEDTRSAWLLRLIDRELDGQAPASATQPAAAPPAPASPAALPDGEPSHGTLCMGPGCFQRDTRRYGLRRLPLCTACAAALQGQAYQREAPPGAARTLRRGTAA
jgi:hypothetical protein